MDLNANNTAQATLGTPYNNGGVIFAAATFFPLCVFGVIANIITIVVVLTSSRLKSSFYYIMMSLSVSDLMSALISPLFVYRRTWGYDDWRWTDGLCKIFWAADLWTSYVTSIHILMFAFLRFISVYWPHHFSVFTLFRTKVTIVVVWAVTFGVGFVPYSMWFAVVKRVRISGVPGSNWPSCSVDVGRIYEFTLYPRIAYPIFFYIPIILVIILSLVTGVKLLLLRRSRGKLISKRSKKGADSTEAKRRRKEKQIVIQLSLIVGSFLVGYIPRTAFHFHAAIAPVNPSEAVINWWFSISEFLTLRVSECLNPIFYNVSSRKMREETKATMQMICARCRRDDDVKRATIKLTHV